MHERVFSGRRSQPGHARTRCFEARKHRSKCDENAGQANRDFLDLGGSGIGVWKFSYQSGNFFRPTPRIGPRKWGVGVKCSEARRLGKTASRSDAARQTPPGHPGLEHTSFRAPSDATPPRCCRDTARYRDRGLGAPLPAKKKFKNFFSQGRATGGYRAFSERCGALQWPLSPAHTRRVRAPASSAA